jgi:hypothetical protein
VRQVSSNRIVDTSILAYEQERFQATEKKLQEFSQRDNEREQALIEANREVAALQTQARYLQVYCAAHAVH